MPIKAFRHIAIIASDYECSKRFYIETLGFEILSESNRTDPPSIKLDLIASGGMQIELFSFPNPPEQVDNPEACGLRPLAFAIDDIESEINRLQTLGVDVNPIRVNELTGNRYTFFKDPDGLPLELVGR